MIVHYFLVEYGHTGELYILGCVGDADTIKNRLYSLSRDVRFMMDKEREDKIRGSSDLLKGDGLVVSCKFYCDKFNSITRSRRLRWKDERYE